MPAFLAPLVVSFRFSVLARNLCVFLATLINQSLLIHKETHISSLSDKFQQYQTSNLVGVEQNMLDLYNRAESMV